MPLSGVFKCTFFADARNRAGEVKLIWNGGLSEARVQFLSGRAQKQNALLGGNQVAH